MCFFNVDYEKCKKDAKNAYYGMKRELFEGLEIEKLKQVYSTLAKLTYSTTLIIFAI